jgi:arabinose-5-phosphate isomerase
MLEKNQNINVLQASDIMTENSKTINSTTLASDALYIMEQNNISQLIVMDGNIYCGIVHIHDILKEGI